MPGRPTRPRPAARRGGDSAAHGVPHRCRAPLALGSGRRRLPLALNAGDVDETVSGVLTTGLVASDVNGATIPAGFTRIHAYRSGLIDGDIDACFERF